MSDDGGSELDESAFKRGRGRPKQTIEQLMAYRARRGTDKPGSGALGELGFGQQEEGSGLSLPIGTARLVDCLLIRGKSAVKLGTRYCQVRDTLLSS
jgi:hypothetical protein